LVLFFKRELLSILADTERYAAECPSTIISFGTMILSQSAALTLPVLNPCGSRPPRRHPWRYAQRSWPCDLRRVRCEAARAASHVRNIHAVKPHPGGGGFHRYCARVRNDAV
jgi:hypothetical protein